MPRGTVLWFHPTKGFGFIAPASGGRDVFVHIASVQKAGLRALDEGQQVEFEIETRDGRPAAANLRPVDAMS